MNIIAADVGGTKTRLIWVNSDQPQQLLYECQYNSNDYSDLVSLIDAFLQDCGQSGMILGMLSLALPGAVEGEEFELTNLPWKVSSAALKKHYAISHVILVNDFQASSLGLEALETNALVMINQGRQATQGVSVTVGAGTGLGLSWMSNGEVFATEAGHIDFAPVTQRQIELLDFLMKHHGHVSYERILSGAGLVSLYEFCSGEAVSHSDAAWVTMQVEKDNVYALEAVRLFTEIYGAYIGNVALLFRPAAGIFITGGIAPKIIRWMQSAYFLDAFNHKGRMRTLTEQTRVYVVTDERVGALGALSLALDNMQDK